MAGFKMDDYVDVAERQAEFFAAYPTGSLKTGTPPFVMEIAGRPFIVYHAQAFRTPDDLCPADGWAWEPVPGPTQFTKDSELMNAETAAWGRAIVAAGFRTKKIASAQEVQARKGSGERETPVARGGSAGEAPDRGPVDSTPAEPAANGQVKLASDAQRKRLFAIAKESNVEMSRLREILVELTGQEHTDKIPVSQYDAVVQAVQLEAVPFE